MVRIICCIIAFLVAMVVSTYSTSDSEKKSLLIKEADIIAVAKVSEVTSLTPPGMCAAKNAYAFRADVETEYPIKGDPGKLFIMYSTGKT